MSEKYHVLIVDDNQKNCNDLAKLLMNDYHVTMFGDGEEFLTYLSRQVEVDLIFLSEMKPCMAGYVILERLRQIISVRNVPIIMVAATDERVDCERGLKLGAVDYVTTPFNEAMIKARLETHVCVVRQRNLLENLTGKDSVTAIDSRRRFDEVLEKEWRRSSRSKMPLSLALVEIDYFAGFTDHYGHGRSDQMLQRVAQALTATLRRPGDMVARYEGSKFVLLCAETDPEGGQLVVEKMRSNVEALRIVHEHSQVGPYVTVSIGGATVFADDGEANCLLEAAESMLYLAKQNGCNQVVWSWDPPDSWLELGLK